MQQSHTAPWRCSHPRGVSGEGTALPRTGESWGPSLGEMPFLPFTIQVLPRGQHLLAQCSSLGMDSAVGALQRRPPLSCGCRLPGAVLLLQVFSPYLFGSSPEVQIDLSEFSPLMPLFSNVNNWSVTG